MPPEGVISTAPSLPPVVLTLVTDPEIDTADAGPVTTDSHVDVHPLASDTVTVYVPAVNPLMDDVTAVVLHK